MLYQKWDTNTDAIIFTRSVTNVDYVLSDMKNFVVMQDLANTAGNGICYRDSTGNLLTWTDGNRAENIAVYGFAEHGWKIPAGMVPGNLIDCRGFASGGAGCYLNIAPNGSVHEITGFSGDQNGLGTLYIKGGAGVNTKGVLNLKGIKNEATANIYRVGAGRGDYAVTFEACGGLRVAMQGIETAAGSSETAAPEGLIKIIAGSQAPNLTWTGGMAVRVLTGQTTGVSLYTNQPLSPVLINDMQNSKTVILRAGACPGCYVGENLAIVFGSTGLNLPVIIGSNQYNAPAAAGESGGSLQIAGNQPVLSLFNTGGAAGRNHGFWTVDPDGTIALRSISSSGVVDDTPIKWTRPAASGKVLTLGTAAGGVAFFNGAGRTKPTITGSRGGNAALASLLLELSNLGLIVDSSTA